MLNLIRKYKFTFIFGSIYLLSTPIILKKVVENYQCQSLLNDHCIFFSAPTLLFFVINLFMGWIVIWYISAFINRLNITFLLKLLMPIILILYFTCIYYSSTLYELVTPSKIIVSDLIQYKERLVVENYQIAKIHIEESSYSDGGTHYTFILTTKQGESRIIGRNTAEFVSERLSVPIQGKYKTRWFIDWIEDL